MIRNLDVDKYQNGDPIPQVTSAAWDTLTTGAYCYYDNDSTTYAAVYGKLYNWYAVNDPRGLAPKGWHVPTNAEWTTLASCLGGVTQAGGKMKFTTGYKSQHPEYWQPPNTGATNTSRFSALPGGWRAYGVFNNVGFIGSWWSSTEAPSDSSKALCVSLYSLSSWIDVTRNGPKTKASGFSVRCILDN